MADKIKLSEFRPLGDKIFVTGIERGMSKTAGGIILADDNLKEHGIRPRWSQVAVLGPTGDKHGVSVGDWVLVEHGRWTLKMTFEGDNGEDVDLWMIDPKAMMIASDKNPANERYEIK